MRNILRGGVKNPQSIPPELLKEMYDVGNRPDHYRAFVSLLRNAASWEAAGAIYGNIWAPVLLVWADSDWAKVEERERARARIPEAQMVTIKNGGHFLPLEQPEALLTQIMRFGNSESCRASNSRSYLTS